MLRLISTGNSLPYSWPRDPNATFLPGMAAQLKVVGNAVVCGPSNGMAPIGIIDDQRTKAFSALSWDEEVVVQAVGVPNGAGQLITTVEYQAVLKNPNVYEDSFVSSPTLVHLLPRNGVVIFPVGTVLNFDLLGTGTPNAIRTFVRYSYQIPNVPGDDSTEGSGRITVWMQRGIYETDQIEASASFPLNAPLFSSEKGLWTTRAPFPDAPSVAIVTAPPTAFLSNLQFLFL